MLTKTDQNRHAETAETRCECGQLIAKLRDRGIELKCKRCKRIVLIPFSSIEGWASLAHLSESPTTSLYQGGAYRHDRINVTTTNGQRPKSPEPHLPPIVHKGAPR
ncbi:MAG: hypothetical protein FJ245_00450 [Nitrospira sp.]|nr:hypothetical protein [Nitrospira sp.]